MSRKPIAPLRFFCKSVESPVIEQCCQVGKTTFCSVWFTVFKIEYSFRKFINRSDIAIILISQSIADMVRYIIDAHTAPIPTILEIPSKDAPYDPSKVRFCYSNY